MTTDVTEPVTIEPTDDAESPPAGRRTLWAEIAVAAVTFLGFCVAILLKKAQLMEPDDYAYRASIVALSEGHIALSTAQYHALSKQVGGIQQWVQLPSGKWMSEKNPGYPFYAVVFQWLHALRFAPLFAGGLASTSLFIAARKWLGRWAGTWATIFFLASGMALAFGYRATMPTFTDASFIAAGAGAVLWAMLSMASSPRRRTVVGLLGFLALELATFMRYTDVIMLIVASIAVVVGFKAAKLRRSMLCWWLGSAAAFGAMVLVFDTIFYGHPTKTGYANGEITFSMSSIIPNLKHMPSQLVHALPAVVLAGAGLVWMAVRLVRRRRATSAPVLRDQARRDGLIGLFLAAGWLGLWALYMAYTWTAQMGGGAGPGGGGGGGGSIHVIRFYVPAIGLVALLATWFVMQLPRWLPPLIALVAVGTAYGSYHSLVEAGGLGGHLGGSGGFPGFGSGHRPSGGGFYGRSGTPPKGFRLPSGAKPPTGGAPPSGFRPPS